MMIKVLSNLKYIVRGKRVYVRGIFSDGTLEKLVDFKPYFYTNCLDVDTIKNIGHVVDVIDDNFLFKNDAGEYKVLKVVVDFPFNVPIVRRVLREMGYITYESDVLFIHRTFIDNYFKIDVSMDNVAYIDIEVDDSDGFPREYGKYSIKAVSIISDNGKHDAFFHPHDYTDEREMLWAIGQFLLKNKLTILVGWNVDFDINHLIERAKQYEMSLFALDFAMAIDLMVPYKQAVKGLPDYKLDTVLKYEGLGEKVKHDKKICEMDYSEIFDYNFNDAFSLKLINDKYNFVDTYIMRMINNNLPMEFLKPLAIGESRLMRKIFSMNKYVAPDKIRVDKKGYMGAIVLRPKAGLYNYVAYFDVNSLYPNIIINEKIDIDGFNGEVMPTILKELLELRAVYKTKYKETGDAKYNIAQNALKIDANSLYGLYGTKGFRWFNENKALQITTKGQEILKRIKTFLESELNIPVLYGDSVAKDSRILIRKDGKIRFVNIEDLFEGDPNYVEVLVGKEYKFLEGIETITLDGNGKLVWKKVPYVMRHKVDKKMYRVWLTNYWYVDVTEDHSLFGYVNIVKRRNCMKCDKLGLVEVKPTEIGDIVKLLIIPKGCVVDDGYVDEVEIKKWELIGYCVGNGSWGGRSYGAKYYVNVSFGNDEEELVEKLLKPLKECGYITNYYKSKSRKGDYRILSKNFVRDLMMFKDENGKYIPEFVYNMPKDVICAFLRGYFSADGTIVCRDKSVDIRLTSVNERLVEGVRVLLFIVGISNSVIIESNENRWKGKKSGTYSKHVYVMNNMRFANLVGFILDRKNERLKCIKEAWRKKNIAKYEFDLKRVIRIEEIEYSDYVYDIEVKDTHRFFANGILVHNTDGIFCDLSSFITDDMSVEESYDVANQIAEMINDNIDPFRVKTEAILRKMIFLKGSSGKAPKKRYIGLVLDSDKWLIRGIELRRSNYCELSKIVQEHVIRMIFEEHSKDDVYEYLYNVRNGLRKGLHDDKLIISVGVKNLEDYDVNQPHVKALRKAVNRGYIPPDLRIRFVYIRNRHMLDVEPIINEGDLERVSKERMIDYNYYWDTQIYSPVKRIIDAVFDNHKQLKITKFTNRKT